jgi:hypothetical protein
MHQFDKGKLSFERLVERLRLVWTTIQKGSYLDIVNYSCITRALAGISIMHTGSSLYCVDLASQPSRFTSDCRGQGMCYIANINHKTEIYPQQRPDLEGQIRSHTCESSDHRVHLLVLRRRPFALEQIRACVDSKTRFFGSRKPEILNVNDSPDNLNRTHVDFHTDNMKYDGDPERHSKCQPDSRTIPETAPFDSGMNGNIGI